ncbi:MAG: formyl transferase [Nitrosomonadaceae bacterium]|nr:formyl transferase [Nitrosomonadaceae bacterium]|tara:strand:+ start:1200 stop:1970 length:771 start_codon:yes stop_codon:yes gene_type:complete
MTEMQDCKTNLIVFFADQTAGLDAITYVLNEHSEHLNFVVTMEDNEISDIARSFNIQTFCYEEITAQNAKSIFGKIDLIFLAWWPEIIPDYIIQIPRIGVVNFHPSFLPYNRGKHYNFWTIVEGTPFGVTLHFVNEGIDSGDIIYQTAIEKTWVDTGGSLFLKAREAIITLFKEKYLDIVNNNYTRIPQNLETGKFHFAKELEPASQIHLDKTYSARELLNLLRARTFKGKPACYFFDGGKKYEVRVSIEEVDSEL